LLLDCLSEHCADELALRYLRWDIPWWLILSFSETRRKPLAAIKTRQLNSLPFLWISAAGKMPREA
jgi:hypothetical protein